MAAPMSKTVADFVSGVSDNAAKEIATEINKKNAKFLEFIELLGDSLTSENTVVRGRATALIGDVLASLPLSFLTNEQVKVVASFLQAKLADHHSVQPSALQSLAVLTSRCSPLPDDLPQQLCHAIFREIQNQTLSQGDRCANYTIFKNLLGTSFKEIKSMGGDFVIGFIQQIDAEKDPRNLLLVFDCAQFVCSNLHLGPFSEEMFEVLGCYFPIDFTPSSGIFKGGNDIKGEEKPPNEANAVTKEDLISSLRKCFATTAEFAPHCIPLLVEKMTSDLQSARLDAFQTLVECAPVYGKLGMKEFHGSILSVAKREILMGISVDLVNIAREAITALFKVLSPLENVDTTNDDALTPSIVEFYQDFSKYFGGSDSVKSCLAMSMCTAMGKASPKALSVILPLALPDFIKQCDEQVEETAQSVFLQEVNGSLQCLKKFSSSTEIKNSFSSISERVLDLYEKVFTRCTKCVLCLEVVKGLTFLLTAEGLVETERTTKLVKVLCERALSEQDNTVRQEIHKSLKLCLEANLGESKQIVDQLLSCLGNHSNRNCVLETLKYAVVEEGSFSKSCDVLLEQMSSPLQEKQYQTVVENVKGLFGLIESQRSEPSCAKSLPKIALSLMKVTASLSSQWSLEEESKYSDYLQCCRDSLKLISNSLPSKESLILWDHIIELMKDGKIPGSGSQGTSSDLRPLKTNSGWKQTRLISFIEGFLIGARFQAFSDNIEDVFESLYTLANHSDDEFTHLSACRCSSVIMNKAAYGSQIHWLLEGITEQLTKRMTGGDPLPERRNSLRLWAWMTKGMECRGHSAVAIFSAQLVSMLSNPVLGKDAALCLALIVEDMDWLLSSKLNSNMTPLYKQRFFSINLKSLLLGYEDSKNKPEIRENYLTAFSHITSNLPLQIIKPHLTKLVPLLLLSLERPTDATHHHSLSTLRSAIANAPDAISSCVDTLIPKLLDIARNDASLKSRIAALECLQQMIGLPIHCISPHQNKVVRELVKTLDDKKRLVRKQAVETRTAWILLEPCNK